MNILNEESNNFLLTQIDLHVNSISKLSSTSDVMNWFHQSSIHWMMGLFIMRYFLITNLSIRKNFHFFRGNYFLSRRSYFFIILFFRRYSLFYIFWIRFFFLNCCSIIFLIRFCLRSWFFCTEFFFFEKFYCIMQLFN